MIMALGMAIVTEAFPDRERGKQLGLSVVCLHRCDHRADHRRIILQSLTWHWLFFVNLPIGLIGLVLVILFVPARKPAGKQRFDFGGAATLFVSLMSLLLSLSFVQLHGLSDPFIYICLVIGVVSVVLFIRIEKRVSDQWSTFPCSKATFFDQFDHRLSHLYGQRWNDLTHAFLFAEHAGL
jgi:predicted permease